MDHLRHVPEYNKQNICPLQYQVVLYPYAGGCSQGRHHDSGLKSTLTSTYHTPIPQCSRRQRSIGHTLLGVPATHCWACPSSTTRTPHREGRLCDNASSAGPYFTRRVRDVRSLHTVGPDGQLSPRVGSMSTSESAISQWGWDFHTARSGIDPGDLRFLLQFVGVV